MLHAFTLHFICSYALSPMHLFILLVRSFICSFARSLFVQSLVCFLFVYSLVCFLFLLSHSFPFSFFFLLTRFLSLSLTHSFLFSFILFVSVTRSLSPLFTHSFVFIHSLVPSLFSSNFCSQYFTVSFILFLNFFFISCHPRVVPFSLGLLTCLFVRHSVAFWFPDPLSPFLTPSPSIFFSSSVLLSSLPICYFFVLNSQRNVSHFNPSKGCFIEKIFYKTVYSSYVVHGTAFRVFLSHLYCRRKETLHW